MREELTKLARSSADVTKPALARECDDLVKMLGADLILRVVPEIEEVT